MTVHEEKEWRAFEILVAQIERHLSPHGAIVKSPDRLKDKITGQLREVDASIKYQIGSVPILITIECRDRSRVQDDTWIEQLAKKKEKIAASATIAVSANGFTKPAQKSAKIYGIELRTLNEINEDEYASIIDNVNLEVEFREWKYLDFKVNLEIDDPEVKLDDDFLKEISGKGYEGPVAIRKKDDKPITLGEIGEKFVFEGLYPPVSGIKPFGKVQLKEPYFIPTNRGNVRVNGFDIMVQVNFIKRPCTLKKVFEYGDLDHPLVRMAEYEFEDIGKLHIAITNENNAT